MAEIRLTAGFSTVPEPEHRQIYATLRVPADVMQPVKTWHLKGHSDEKNPNL